MSAQRPESTVSEVLALERRLARERAARKSAEALLEEKSRALYEAVQTARRATRKLELALWASGEAIWEWDAETDELRFTTPASGDAAPQVECISSLDYLARIHPEDLEGANLAWRLLVSGVSSEYDVQFRERLSGRWLRVRGRATERAPGGAAIRVLGTAKDVTGLRRKDETLRLLGLAFANATEPLLLCSAGGIVLDANRAMGALSGVAVASLSGRPLVQLLPGTDLADDDARSSPDLKRWIDVSLTVDGRRTPVDAIATRLGDDDVGGARWIISIRDLRETKRIESEVTALARFDRLTGLLNRHALQQQLAESIDAADSLPLPILLLNIDGFRTVNDSVGARDADGLLATLAGRIARSLPDGWTLGRWGGDEFVVIGTLGEDVRSAQQVGIGVLAAVAEPLVLDGAPLSLTASAGIAVYPDDGDHAEALLHSAGVALRAAKRDGRARIECYTGRLEEDGLRRLTLVNLLRRACDAGEFQFVAQPRVDAGRRTVGHEVLIRWQTLQWGAVSPAVFIPLAEENGMIDRIGRLAIRSAAKLAADLRDRGVDEAVSVNLAARQLRDTTLVDQLLAELHAYDVPPGAIELEVTESGLIDDIDATKRLLEALRGEGFTLALDDFGTGYSSLGYLESLPFDKVKLDRSFIRAVAVEDRSRRLVRGVVELCNALGMCVVAEGVETDMQFEALRSMGIGEFQGYRFHRPMAFDAVLALPRR